jgi:hypothetical protein
MYVNGAATTLNTVAGNWVSGGTFSIGRAAQGGAYSQTIYGEAGVATSFNNSTTIGLLDTDIKTRWNL